MRQVENLGALIGRFLMALIFVASGLTKFGNLGGTAQMMAGGGLSDPGGLHLLALGAAIVEVFGGLLLLVGLQSRIVAFVLFLFLIPTTIIFHVIPGGLANQINAFKNLAIMGGLLMVATQGGGGLSFDGARARAG